jgi:polyferredoxin
MKLLERWNKLSRSQKVRYLLILLGIALFFPPISPIPQIVGEPNFCGKLCPRLFFIPSGSPGIGSFISKLLRDWAGAILLGTILITTLFFGRLWCSHLCPIGGTAEAVSKGLPKRALIDFRRIEAVPFRYGYFSVYLFAVVIGIGSIACKFCNFRVIPFLIGSPFEPAYRAYFLTSVGAIGILVIAAFGFFAKGGRAYCNFFCPVGAFDGLANLIGEKLRFTKRVRTDISKCKGCGECIDPCMVWALRLKGSPDSLKIERDALSCMSCKKCVDACPNRATAYRRQWDV